MRRALTSSLIAMALFLVAIGCSSSGDTATAETQRQFGVRMAKMNLWREAMFRFRRAVEIDPNNATAHNNLAVSLEATGDLDGAAREYREALRLDRTNQYIQRNYSRFIEFTQRGKKRDPKTATTPAATATTTAEAPVAPPVTSTEAPLSPPPTTTDTATPPATTTTNPPGGPR